MRAQGHPLLWTVLSFAIVFVAWELTVRLFALPEYLLPGPEPVFVALAQNIKTLAAQSLWTAGTVLAGFLVAAAVAIPLAMLIVISPVLERLLYPPMVATQSIPKIALAPLFIVWLGVGSRSCIVVAVFIAFFPVVVSTATGLVSVKPDVLQLCRSLTATQWQMFRLARFPYAMPYIFAGMKVAVTMAIIGVVVGEFITAQAGLGYIIMFASSAGETATVLAAIVVLCAIGLVLYGLVGIGELLVGRWYGGQMPTGGVI